MFKKIYSKLIIIFISFSTLFTSSLSNAVERSILDEIIDPQLIYISEWSTASTYKEGQFTDWKKANTLTDNIPFSLLGEERFYKAKVIIGWHHRTRDLAISIGPLKGEDGVYINGFRVDNSRTETHQVLSQNSYKVYRLPRNKTHFSWFNSTIENDLLIKLSSNKSGQKLNFDYVKIGDYETLALQSRDFDSTTKTIQGSAIALLFILILFIIFLYLNQYNKKSNTLFGYFAFFISLSITSTSLFLNGNKVNNDFIFFISTCLDFISTIIFLKIIINKFELNALNYKKNIEIVGIITILITTFFTNSFIVQSWLNVLLHMAVLVLFFMVYYHAIITKPLRTKSNYSILSALTIMFLSVALDTLWGGNSWPLTPYHIGAILASIFLLYSVAQDFKKLTLSMHGMSSRLVNIREIERVRLTRDIHDGVGQGLATIRLYVTMNINKFEPVLGAALQQEVDQTSNTLKSVIRNLKPIEIADGNPSRAIIELARHLCEVAQIKVEIVNTDSVKLKAEVAYQLYRVGQEALNNSIKHSNCSLITIDIKHNKNLLIMSISDNGKGINKQKDNLGYGLSSMQERALLISAVLRINNTINGGTQVCLEVPVND